jgi:hypothetical protein
MKARSDFGAWRALSIWRVIRTSEDKQMKINQAKAYIITLVAFLSFEMLLVPASVAGGDSSKHANLQQAGRKIRTVSFCELTRHPERYVGRQVRINSSYVVWWESSFLYNLKCNNDESKIWPEFNCSDRKCYELVQKQLRRAKDQFAARADVSLVGTLKGPGGFGHLDHFRYMFLINEVESASPIPDDTPWP